MQGSILDSIRDYSYFIDICTNMARECSIIINEQKCR